MRVIVVDDQLGQRLGRVAMLSTVPGLHVEGMDFEQAIALGSAWAEVNIAVVDGHDRRSAQRRTEAADEAGIAALPAYDNFVGVRVAAMIRSQSSAERTRIIMISAHARDNNLRARRIAQAGIDYVFEHYEAEPDQQTFIRAVLQPETFSPTPAQANWLADGYTGEPDVAGAIQALEASPAGQILLDDELGRDHPEHAWGLRMLRQRIGTALRIRLSPVAGPRQRRASRKSELAEHLRQALGRDLPTDPR